MKFSTRIFSMAFLALMIICSTRSIAQVSISAGSTITQNFDAMGATATATLPASWKVDKSTSQATLGAYASAATTTDVTAGTNISTTAGNGVYNFGTGAAGAGTDRAVGGLSSAAASKTVNVYTDLQNNGAGAIGSFTISYDVEKYRLGTNAAGFSIQMYYSTTGLAGSWTSAGANFLTSFPGSDASNSGFATVPGATSSVTSKTLTVSIAATSHLYLAWSYGVTSGTTTSNAQALGIDNVSITAVAAAVVAPVITNSPLTINGTYGTPITNFTITASNSPTSFGTDPLPSGLTFASPTISGTPLAAGTFTPSITASNSGGTDTKTLTINIAKAAQTITFGTLINRNDVDANFHLTGSSTSGLPLTYVSSNTAVVQIVNSGGVVDPAGDWVDITGPGTATITASQAGNSNYLAASSVGQSQTIINTSLTPQTINFTTVPTGKIYGDADFPITATASSGLTVTFTTGDPSIATIVGGSSVHIVGPGTTTIVAHQPGDGTTYSAAPDVSQSFTAGKKTLTVTGATVDTKPYDGGTAANISNGTLAGIIGTDIVNIATTAGTFGSANAGTGIAVTAALTLGGADQVKYILSEPTGLTGDITKANQTITFTGPLANKSPGDANFNYTASANSGLAVSYSSSNTGVIQVVSGSLVHVVAIGSSSITASQAGDANHFAASSVTLTQQVVASTPGSIFANLITDTNPSTSNPYTNGQTFDSHITVSGVGRGSGIVGTAGTGRYNANTWNSATFDANKYFEFTLTPNAGFIINFSVFKYNSQISSVINSWAVRSSVDGYTANIGSPTSGTAATLSTISLSGASYQGITSAITFRVYAWGATAASSTFSINDFEFDGNVIVAPPTATFTKANVSSCGLVNDGKITVVASGVSPFTYSWTGETGSNHTPFTAGNVSSLTGLNYGYYNVTVADANLNTVTITGIHVEKGFPVYITNSGSTSNACGGNTGAIVLYGTNGIQPYTYSLDGVTYVPGNTFSGLAAGSYTGYVKDAAGCVSSKPITVAAAATLVISPFVRNASACSNDGSIEIYRSGGITPYSYSIDGVTYQSATNKYSNLAAGSYTVYVKDATGCIAQQTVSVTQGTGVTVTANKTSTSTCQSDGSIQLNATGGTAPYMYSIDDGANYQSSNSFTGLSADSYPTKVKDSKGCTGSLNVTISLNTISVTAYVVPASNCAASNGSIQLFRTGGVGPYTYSLDGNTYQSSGIFTGLAPDFYTGYVKDSKTCIGQLVDIIVGPESCLGRTASTAGRSAATSVQENTTLKIQAYPNPTSTEFTLQLNGYSSDKIAIIVTDVMGRKVYQVEGNGKQQYRFGSKFNAGLYNVQVIQGNDKKSIKLVKE